MKIRIVKAGASTYWYADKIGEVFDVTGTDHPTRSGYSVRYDGECSKYYVNSDDCEVVNEEADEMGVIEKMQADIAELRERVSELEQIEKKRIYDGAYEDYMSQQDDECEEPPKSPQEIRDEIVAKARADVNCLELGNYQYGNSFEYVVNRNKRTIVALGKITNSGIIVLRGIAKADPSDCFNVHIGKAIALRRALGKPVPRIYLDAPAPTEVREGDVVEFTSRRGEVKRRTIERISDVRAYTGQGNYVHIDNGVRHGGKATNPKTIDDSREVAE